MHSVFGIWSKCLCTEGYVCFMTQYDPEDSSSVPLQCNLGNASNPFTQYGTYESAFETGADQALFSLEAHAKAARHVRTPNLGFSPRPESFSPSKNTHFWFPPHHILDPHDEVKMVGIFHHGKKYLVLWSTEEPKSVKKKKSCLKVGEKKWHPIIPVDFTVPSSLEISPEPRPPRHTAWWNTTLQQTRRNQPYRNLVVHPIINLRHKINRISKQLQRKSCPMNKEAKNSNPKKIMI